MKDFDISQLELADTATLEVKRPDGEDLLVNGDPVTITLYGSGSKQHVAAKHKLDNATQVKSIALIRGKVQKNLAEENLQMQAEFLAACTVSIQNLPIAPIDLYKNPKLSYITDQVSKFLGDAENFMPSLPTK